MFVKPGGHVFLLVLVTLCWECPGSVQLQGCLAARREVLL